MGLLELLILLLIVSLILGPKRITALFRSLGRGAKDFTDQLGGNNKTGEDKKELPDEEQRSRKEE
jgi:sec-independent protein translocase protein TatA